MGLVADCGTGDVHIMGAGIDGEGVVPVVDGGICDNDACAGNLEAVRVEGKAACGAVGGDNAVGDGDVGACEAVVPGDGVERLQVGDGAVGQCPGREVRATREACGVGWVCVPERKLLDLNEESVALSLKLTTKLGHTS